MMRELRACVVLVAALALPPAASPQQTPGASGVDHVLLIGVDGLSPEGIKRTETPFLHELMAAGAYTLAARGVIPTVSSPNWASMLMAAGPELHGITTND